MTYDDEGFPMYPEIGDIHIDSDGSKYEYIGDFWVQI